MADLVDVRTVLEQCGIADEQARNTLITNEGFNSIADIGVMKTDKDVDEMAKRSMSRTANDGRVNIGTVAIKRLQGLVFWINDRILRGLTVTAADFTPEEMANAMNNKVYRKERAEGTEPSVKDLGKFNPDEFEVHDDAFVNLMARTFGVLGESLRYVVRDEEEPDEFESEEQRRMYQLPLEGEAYEMDNATTYRKLKAFLIETPGYTWIEAFDTAEDGRGAYLAWTGHYNGQGELSKRTALAKTRLESLYYKSETYLSFELYSGRLKRIFQVLNKDPDERVSPRQQVEYLLKGIRTEDGELKGSKAVISNQYARDFDAACAFFSREVSRLHGPAQLEAARNKGKKRGIYAFEAGGRGRGRFGGRYGGRGFGGGRGGRFGRGGGQNGGRAMINGIDVSDPTRVFSNEEWAALQSNGGLAYVLQARDRINGRFRGRGGRGGRSQGGRGYGGNYNGRGDNRNVSFAGSDNTQSDAQQNEQQQQQRTGNGGRGDRGGRNGRGFGRGAHGGRY